MQQEEPMQSNNMIINAMVIVFISFVNSSIVAKSTFCFPVFFLFFRNRSIFTISNEKSTAKKKKGENTNQHFIINKLLLALKWHFIQLWRSVNQLGPPQKAYQQQFLEWLALHVEQMSIQHSPSQELRQTLPYWLAFGLSCALFWVRIRGVHRGIQRRWVKIFSNLHESVCLFTTGLLTC